MQKVFKPLMIVLVLAGVWGLVVSQSDHLSAQGVSVSGGPGIDVTTGGGISLSMEHHEIHEGDGYRIVSAVDDDTLLITFKTPNTTKWAHMVVDWGSEASGTLAILEGATWDQGTGLQVPIFNRNRNSANSSGLLEDSQTAFSVSDSVGLNPSGLSGGTDICPDITWTVGKTGVSTRGQGEFVAKQNSTYAILLLTSPANGLKANVRFYMHTNKH